MSDVLFIIGSFTIGGIQSNFVRLFKELKSNSNITVLLLANKIDQNMFDELKRHAEVIYLDSIVKFKIGGSSAINHSVYLDKEKVLSMFGDTVSIIHSVDSETLVVGEKISKILNAKLTVGSYHPRELTWMTKGGWYFRGVQQKILANLSNKNIFYCNDDIAEYSLKFRNKLSCLPEAVVIPLAIADNIRVSPHFDGNKIISIGRLVEWKSYAKHMINILDEINIGKQFPYEYHIYGTGPDEEKLRKISSKSKSKIVFHGNLDYSKFSEVLEDSFVFLGCGSALMEAASLGVPAIYGIESAMTPETYGFYSEVAGTNIGENNVNLCRVSYQEVFERLNSMSKEEYYLLSDREYLKSKNFMADTIAEKWLDHFDVAEHIAVPVQYSHLKYFISNFLWNTLNKVKVLKDRGSRY
jgi:glycosyltransferase involved in cell wall biosynthesis